MEKKKSIRNKIVFLVFCFLGMATVMASGTFKVSAASGSCGENAKWNFDESTGALSITGTGEVDFGNIERQKEHPFYTFRDQIQSVSIQTGITSLGDYFLYGAGEITSVTVPEGVVTIGERAFFDCDNLTTVKLPSTVKTIGESAFNLDEKLTNINMPASLETIGYGAFWRTALSGEITFPSTLKKIDNMAFYECSKLTKVTMKEGLEYIGENAFSLCGNITEMTIPTTVTHIGNGALDSTKWYQSLTGEFIILGDHVLCGYTGKAKEIVIPEDVKYISNGAVAYDDTIESVTIPKKVTTLDKNTFIHCDNLNTITILGEIKEVGAGALDGTAYLKNNKDDFVIVSKALYQYQGNATEVTIPDGVVSITDDAFSFQDKITKVNLPNSLTTIGGKVFLGCSALKNLYVPKSVTSIADYSIGCYCENGNSGYMYYDNTFKLLGHKNTAAETYAKEHGVTFVDVDHLSGTCGDTAIWTFSLKTGTLTISGTGKMIDDESYRNIDSMITSVKVEDGITEIGEGAFKYLTNCKEVRLSDSITSLGARAFADTDISKIDLPKSLKELNSYCFSDCKKLKEITLPASLSTYGNDVFSGAKRLERILVQEGNLLLCDEDGILYDVKKSKLFCMPMGHKASVVTLPETVTTISSHAFYGVKNLKTIVFDSRVDSVSYSSIANCNQLQNYVFKGLPANNIKSVLSKNNITVYCDLTNDKWTAVKEELSNYDIVWKSYDNSSLSSEMNVQVDRTSLKVGEESQASALISPLLATNVVWESSDHEILNVIGDGHIIGVAPGTATVTASSLDGAYQDSVTITVTGTAFSQEKNKIYKLPEKVIEFTGFEECKQVPSKSLHGIFFISQKAVQFYSYVTEKLYKVCNLPSTDYYVSDQKIYAVNENTVQVYDLESQKTLLQFEAEGESVNAIGADQKGRIYLSESGEKIRLYDKDGVFLSEATCYKSITDFSGFDSTNNNFYAEAPGIWRSWGYDHTMMGLYAGTVKENQIIYENYMIPLDVGTGSLQEAMNTPQYICFYQMYYQDSHKNNAQLLGDKYLVAHANIFGGLFVKDSNAFDATEQSREYNWYVSRSSEDENSTEKVSDGIGVRAVYRKASDSIIAYTKDKELEERSAAKGDILSKTSIAHPAFSMEISGDTISIIEKEGEQYYLETKSWSSDGDLSITGETTTMEIGEKQALKAASDGSIMPTLSWSTSDKSIATVSKDGVVNAWKEGSVTITCSTLNEDKKATYDITVKPLESKQSGACIEANGKVTNNKSANEYQAYGKVVKSYLYEQEDGSITRVEYLGEEGVLVETYSKNHELISTKTLEMKLPLFGGFYHGQKNEYLIFGQRNEEESDHTEVLRIVQYDKEFNEITSASVNGANTYIPFDAGSLRCTETNGKLYVHTCHEMYQSDDGVHHQANMTYVVDEATMTVEDQNYVVSNTTTGYVSHSFNQFIKTDGTNLYRVDHGDAYPRGIALVKSKVGDSLMNVSYIVPFGFKGTTGNNNTNASVGGLELSDDNCLIVGKSIDQSEESKSNVYNIFLTIASKTLKTKKTVALTEYKNSNVVVRNPQIVKVTDNQFLILWEEVDAETRLSAVKMVMVDGDGTVSSEPVTKKLALSDCQPIRRSKTCVEWYVSNGKNLYFYQVNPFHLDSTPENPSAGEENLNEPIEEDDPSIVKPGSASKAGEIGTGIVIPSGENRDSSVNKNEVKTKKEKSKQAEKEEVNEDFSSTNSNYKNVIGKVKLSSVKAKKGRKVTVKFKKLKRVSGYEITFALDKKYKKGKIVKRTKKTSVTYKLKKKAKYYVRVRAYAANANSSKVYGNYSAVKSVKVK